MKNMMWILIVVLVLGFLYMSRESFGTSSCPSFCRTPGNMHPVCVQGRLDGRANCGSSRS